MPCTGLRRWPCLKLEKIPPLQLRRRRGSNASKSILIGPPHHPKFGWMGAVWGIAFAIWMSPRRLRPLRFIRQFGIV